MIGFTVRTVAGSLFARSVLAIPIEKSAPWGRVTFL